MFPLKQRVSTTSTRQSVLFLNKVSNEAEEECKKDQEFRHKLNGDRSKSGA